MSDNLFAEATSITEVVDQVIAATSMCWAITTDEDTFDVEMATYYSREAVSRIRELIFGGPDD